MRIGPGDLEDAATVAFLEAHAAQLRAASPPGSAHVLDLAGLRIPEVTFLEARDRDEVVGCAALMRLEPAGSGHAELKSMRTAPTRLRQGVATVLLAAVIDEARAAGYRRMSLETGSQEFFAPARALYARHGFVECDPFADYRPDPHSTFMTRLL